MIRNALITLLLLSTTSLTGFAADYDYPELMVSPRATERLKLELDKEALSGFFSNQPGAQMAYALTLVNGALMMGNTNEVDDVDKNASKLGLVVGVVGLGSTLFMSAKYQPYRKGLENANRIKGKGKRAELARERLAEEAIHDAARLGKRLDYIAAGSTLIANAYMFSVVQEDTLSEPLGILGMVTSIVPIVFGNYWSNVAKIQREYKKKVYGPIAFNSFLYDSASKKYIPGANFAFSF